MLKLSIYEFETMEKCPQQWRMIHSELIENECILIILAFYRNTLLSIYFADSFRVEEKAVLSHLHGLRSWKEESF